MAVVSYIILALTFPDGLIFLGTLTKPPGHAEHSVLLVGFSHSPEVSIVHYFNRLLKGIRCYECAYFVAAGTGSVMPGSVQNGEAGNPSLLNRLRRAISSQL